MKTQQTQKRIKVNHIVGIFGLVITLIVVSFFIRGEINLEETMRWLMLCLVPAVVYSGYIFFKAEKEAQRR